MKTNKYCRVGKAKPFRTVRRPSRRKHRASGHTSFPPFDYLRFTIYDLRVSNEFDLPNGGKLTLRAVTKDDDPFLLAVYGSSRAEELAQVEWADGQKEAFLGWQFDLQWRDYNSRFPNAEYAVILLGESQAGRIWIERDEKEIHLLDIAILPEFQNRGIGTLLLRQLIDECVRTQKPLRHTVFMLNADAHRFYVRLGFVDIEDVGAYKRMEWHGDK